MPTLPWPSQFQQRGLHQSYALCHITIQTHVTNGATLPLFIPNTSCSLVKDGPYQDQQLPAEPQRRPTSAAQHNQLLYVEPARTPAPLLTPGNLPLVPTASMLFYSQHYFFQTTVYLCTSLQTRCALIVLWCISLPGFWNLFSPLFSTPLRSSCSHFLDSSPSSSFSPVLVLFHSNFPNDNQMNRRAVHRLQNLHRMYEEIDEVPDTQTRSHATVYGMRVPWSPKSSSLFPK